MCVCTGGRGRETNTIDMSNGTHMYGLNFIRNNSIFHLIHTSKKLRFRQLERLQQLLLQGAEGGGCLVLIQMGVIKTIKSRNMDGGGEGITPVSNIPQRCSGRDHGKSSKHTREEKSEGTGATLDENDRIKLKLTVYGLRTQIGCECR